MVTLLFDPADTLMPALSPEQIAAVKDALAAKDLFFINGASAVDRTILMAELCYQSAKHGIKTGLISESTQTVETVLTCIQKHPEIRAFYKGNTDGLEDKVLSFTIDKVVDSWLCRITSLCQQDLLGMRKEQEQAERMQLELATLAKRQAEIQKEYIAVTDRITRYNELRQELLKIEDELQRDCEALTEQKTVLETEIDKRTLLANQPDLEEQGEKLQEAVAAQVFELQRLDDEKQKLVTCLSLLTSHKPESYVLLNSNRENQITAVAEYKQYLIEFVDVAQKVYRQEYAMEDAFLKQDISLLLELISTIKQRQVDLLSIEEDTLNELHEITQVLIDTAREYGWSTSLLRSETQTVVVNWQSISTLRDCANELLWASPPVVFAKLGFCGQWKKTLSDLIIKAKAMEQLVNLPGTLFAQTTTEIENVLLECRYLTQRIYEACYKQILACGHRLDRSYNQVQEGLVAFTRQLQNTSRESQRLTAQLLSQDVGEDHFFEQSQINFRKILENVTLQLGDIEQQLQTKFSALAEGQCRLAELKELSEQSAGARAELICEEKTIHSKLTTVRTNLQDMASSVNDAMVRDLLVTEWINRINGVAAAEKKFFHQLYSEQANVIGMTFSESAAQFFTQDHPECEVIITDMVSKAAPAEILLPILKGRKVIMVE